MTRSSRWGSIIFLPVSVAFAQGPASPHAPAELSKAVVNVVFAPDYRRTPRPARPVAEGKAGPRSVDATPAQIMSVITGGRSQASSAPMEFTAPEGLTGMRTGPESVMATMVAVGEDGRLRTDCASLPDALERLRAADAGRRSLGKESGNER